MSELIIGLHISIVTPVTTRPAPMSVIPTATDSKSIPTPPISNPTAIAPTEIRSAKATTIRTNRTTTATIRTGSQIGKVSMPSMMPSATAVPDAFFFSGAGAVSSL